MIARALNTIAEWVADGHSFECEDDKLWLVFDGDRVYHIPTDTEFDVLDIAEACDMMRDPDFRCPK